MPSPARPVTLPDRTAPDWRPLDLTSSCLTTPEKHAIQPTKFTSPPTFSSRPHPILETPPRGRRDDFRKIMDGSVYQGSGTAQQSDDRDRADSRKRGRELEITSHLPYKAAKRARCDDPVDMRVPVFVENGPDLRLEDIASVKTRMQVAQMGRILPKQTRRACFDALEHFHGIIDDALDYLVKIQERQDSIDRRSRSRSHGPADLSRDSSLSRPQYSFEPKATAKRELKAPHRKIQDKWASTIPQNRTGLRLERSPPPRNGSRPGRRLIQGRRAPSPVLSRSSSIQSIGSDSGVDVGNSIKRTESPSKRILEFFNTCALKDMVDVASTPEDVATKIISHRPFADLGDVRSIEVMEERTNKNGKKRQASRNIGNAVLERCKDMWGGYDAVDGLVRKIEVLGRPVATEMQKWGINIFGAKSESKELELVNFDTLVRNAAKPLGSPAKDSGIGTPTTASSASSMSENLLDQKLKDSFLPQPAEMAEGVVMKDYQLVGLNWLNLMYQKGLSCILADDMGLGKTIQVISLLTHLISEGRSGPHLIVVPSSTLENWLREFKMFSPTVVVEPYYGSQNDRPTLREQIIDNRASINVIVTTYDLAVKADDSKFLRKKVRPDVCVFDEGHVLKNGNTDRYKQLIMLPANQRILLTGTPVQNNLQELAALLGFIMPDLCADHYDDLKYIFKHKAKTSDESHDALLSQERIERARSMISPFILRRKKAQVLKDIPAKHKRYVECEMTPLQQKMYDEAAKSPEAEEFCLTSPAIDAKMSEIASLNTNPTTLMQLRKLAISPLLANRVYTPAKMRQMARLLVNHPELPPKLNSKLKHKTTAEKIESIYDEIYWAGMEGIRSDFELHYDWCMQYEDKLGKFALKNDEWMESGKVQKLTELLLPWKANGDRVLIFSQFTNVLNMLECVMDTLNVNYFRLDGSTKVDDRQDMIDQFYAEPDVTVFLISTKAGGAGINLACANKVVIFDMSFNPQEDIQAENRAHRVGQTREVEVVRLVTKGTVEESMRRMGEGKVEMDLRISGEGEVATVTKTEANDSELQEKILAEEVKEEAEKVDSDMEDA